MVIAGSGKMDKKMGGIKSLYVIGARGVPDVQGGIEKFTSRLYPLLAGKHYRIKILTLKRYTPHGFDQWGNLEIKALPSINNDRLEKLVYNFFATVYCLYKRPDIIHIHSIASGTFVFLLRLFRLKVVCRYNSQDYLYPKWGWLARQLLKFGEKNFFLSNAVVCNSPKYIEIFKRRFDPDALFFVPNGIEFESESGGDQPLMLNGVDLRSFNYILSVGRITPEKGFDVLLAAFNNLKDIDDLKLVIVGDYDLKDEYTRDLCENNNIENVVFTGFLTQKELKDIYFNCSIYVSSSRFEGMSNSVLEAIGYGCKVLLSDIDGNTQLPLADKYFFKSENIEELSGKISELINDEASPDYSELRKVYDWTKIAEKIDSINRSI